MPLAPQNRATVASKGPAPAAQRRAAAASEPAGRHLYDRAEPADPERDVTDRAPPAQNSAAAHVRQNFKHTRKPALARTAPYPPPAPSRFASRGLDAAPPPRVVVMPPQRSGPGRGDGYAGEWRDAPRSAPPRFGRNDWRDRRADDDRGDNGPANLFDGLFGLFGGGDRRD